MISVKNKLVISILLVLGCSQIIYSHKIYGGDLNGDIASHEGTLEDVTCGAGSSSGIYYFPIPSNSTHGPINLLYVAYSAARGLAVTVTAYHDPMNHLQLVPRVDNFRKYPCEPLLDNTIQGDCSVYFTMTERQSNKSGYNTYDRGHIAPANPYRFHESAIDATFYCVNNAPQEPYTNQVPWATVEDRVFRRTTAGFVITGLCQSNSEDGPTLHGIQVPNCYWKMVCYKNGTDTVVVGFIGENSLFQRDDLVAREHRRLETLQARSQMDVINRNGDHVAIERAWTSAAAGLIYNREADLAPNPDDCISTKTLSPDYVDYWSRVMPGEYDPSPEYEYKILNS